MGKLLKKSCSGQLKNSKVGLFQVFLEIILSMNTTQKFLGCTSLVYSFALATRLQPFKMFTKVSPYNCFSICLDSCRHAPACYLVIHIMNPAPHESMKTAVCDMIHLNQMELELYINTNTFWVVKFCRKIYKIRQIFLSKSAS